MNYRIHRSLPVTGDTAIRSSGHVLRNDPCGEWPVTNGFEDKQALNALDVQFDRNSGWPTGCKAQGHGVPIVLVGVTTYQEAWESQA